MMPTLSPKEATDACRAHNEHGMVKCSNFNDRKLNELSQSK